MYGFYKYQQLRWSFGFFARAFLVSRYFKMYLLCVIFLPLNWIWPMNYVLSFRVCEIEDWLIKRYDTKCARIWCLVFYISVINNNRYIAILVFTLIRRWMQLKPDYCCQIMSEPSSTSIWRVFCKKEDYFKYKFVIYYFLKPTRKVLFFLN